MLNGQTKVFCIENQKSTKTNICHLEPRVLLCIDYEYLFVSTMYVQGISMR
jgi:hypothetical protein